MGWIYAARDAPRLRPRRSSERVNHPSSFYASPAKAGAYRSAARAHPRWHKHRDCFKDFRVEEEWIPAFAGTAKGKFADCMFSPISSHASGQGEASKDERHYSSPTAL